MTTLLLSWLLIPCYSWAEKHDQNSIATFNRPKQLSSVLLILLYLSGDHLSFKTTYRKNKHTNSCTVEFPSNSHVHTRAYMRTSSRRLAAPASNHCPIRGIFAIGGCFKKLNPLSQRDIFAGHCRHPGDTL